MIECNYQKKKSAPPIIYKYEELTTFLYFLMNFYQFAAVIGFFRPKKGMEIKSCSF